MGFRFGGDFLYGQFHTKKRKEENKLIVYFYKIKAKKKKKKKKKDKIFFDGGYQYFRFKFGFRIKFYFCIKKVVHVISSFSGRKIFLS